MVTRWIGAALIVMTQPLVVAADDWRQVHPRVEPADLVDVVVHDGRWLVAASDGRLLESADSEPAGSVTDADGCVHSIRRVTDPTVIRQVQLFFRDQPLYIADGHHRYATALGYRRYLRAQKGELSEFHPANHIMMYLCPMEDPGLSVLPTHRLLYWPGVLNVDDLIKRLQPGFDLQEIHAGSRESLIEEALSRMDEIERRTQEKSSTSFGVYHAGEDRCFVMTMKEEGYDQFEIDDPCLKDLDVVVLSELIIKKYFGLDHKRCENDNLIHFYSDPDEALVGIARQYHRSVLKEQLHPRAAAQSESAAHLAEVGHSQRPQVGLQDFPPRGRITCPRGQLRPFINLLGILFVV